MQIIQPGPDLQSIKYLMTYADNVKRTLGRWFSRILVGNKNNTVKRREL